MFDILKGSKKELLNKSDEPLLKVVVYDFQGKKKVIKAKCENCAFVDIDFDNDWVLLCTKDKNKMVEDDHKCNKFNVTRQIMRDFYDGCR